MEAYLDALVLKRIATKNVTHKMLTDEDFIARERQLAIEDTMNLILKDAAIYLDLTNKYEARKTRLKEEMKIVSKYMGMPTGFPAIWRNIIVKYTKELTLYKECTGNPIDLKNLLDPQVNSVEAFTEWIATLSPIELTIVADLVADL